MVFLRELYYTVIVMRGSPLQNKIMKKFLLHLDKKSIANFRLRKYNDLVVQLRISNREFQKGKGECIHYEKAD